MPNLSRRLAAPERLVSSQHSEDGSEGGSSAKADRYASFRAAPSQRLARVIDGLPPSFRPPHQSIDQQIHQSTPGPSKGQYHPVKPLDHACHLQSGSIRANPTYTRRVSASSAPRSSGWRLGFYVTTNPTIHKSINPLPGPSKGQYHPVKPPGHFAAIHHLQFRLHH